MRANQKLTPIQEPCVLEKSRPASQNRIIKLRSLGNNWGLPDSLA